MLARAFSKGITGARGLPHYVAENDVQQKNRGPGIPQALDPALLESCANGRSLDVGVLPSAPQRPWIVILEPDAGVNLLVIVTVYEVPE